ncbi:MAG: response regulator [Desulfatiglans sp.]|jgi:tubulin-specific chaperone A|nr:response regulator [Desulfatiglans sp.]
MAANQLSEKNITLKFNTLLNRRLFSAPVFWFVVIVAIGLILGDYLFKGYISILLVITTFIAALLVFTYYDMLLRLKKADEHSREVEARARKIEVASSYKSQFLANMSHELRTPLNSIILLSQLLSENRENNLTGKQVEYARCVHSSGHDLLNLINQILDLSKIESGKMELNIEDIPLDEMIASIHRKFRPVSEEKNLRFNVKKNATLPGIVASDRQRIEQILNNLLSNAFKFTPQGEIILKIGRPEKDIELSASGLTHEKCISFSVSDTGIGVPKDKINLIFEPFQQGDGDTGRRFGGTGLGLSISRELARLLKGEIQVKSVEGAGSTFSLFLPESLKFKSRANEDIKPAGDNKDHLETPLMKYSPAHDDFKEITKGGIPILLIEDDLPFAETFRDFAITKGFKTIIAQDGETGLDIIARYNIRAIILDITLPGINGLAVMSRLKDDLKTRHIPVYFVSGSDSRREAIRMGATGYISKPANAAAFEGLFSDIEKTAVKSERRLLVIEDNEVTRNLIEKLFEGTGIGITYVSTGKEALQKITFEQFDCVILDLTLPDISGFEILSEIKNNESPFSSPIIVYTGKRLSAHERVILDEYTESIVVKGVNSPARLLDEATLFLHIAESELPEERKKMLRMIHDKDAILKGKKVLIADDDMRNLFVLTNILESKGVSVITAKNGIETLNSLKENPGIDLIIMDMMMPEKDGFMAVKEIREKPDFAELPVIALTARAMKGDRARCIEAGASDYLSKPFEKERLFSILSAWLYNI